MRNENSISFRSRQQQNYRYWNLLCAVALLTKCFHKFQLLSRFLKKRRDCRVGNVSESNCSEVNSKQSLSRDPENGSSMLRSSKFLKPSIQVATPTMQQMNNKENAPHNMPKKVSLRETAIWCYVTHAGGGTTYALNRGCQFRNWACKLQRFNRNILQCCSPGIFKDNICFADTFYQKPTKLMCLQYKAPAISIQNCVCAMGSKQTSGLKLHWAKPQAHLSEKSALDSFIQNRSHLWSEKK